MGYEFGIGPKVIFGEGSVAQLPDWIQRLGGHKALLVTDPALRAAGVTQAVLEKLPGAAVFDQVAAEPTPDVIEGATRALRDEGADIVVALGGGSPIDTAKLAAMLAGLGGELFDYVNDWSLVNRPCLPLVTIPTTVGSGSEMTRGAVFKHPASRHKLVIVSDFLAPRLAILDPALVATLPAQVVVATGSDALTQAIEGILSTAASPFTDALHIQAIGMIAKHFASAVADRGNTEAMGEMQQAAAMVGAGLASSGVGAVHALANTLGGHYRVPHGVACAVMLVPVLHMNAAAAESRFRLVAKGYGITNDGLSDHEAAQHAVAETERLLHAVGVDAWRLRDFGVPESDIGTLAAEAAVHSDMATNPYQPSVPELAELLRGRW